MINVLAKSIAFLLSVSIAQFSIGPALADAPIAPSSFLQHPWSHAGSDANRDAYIAGTGPESPALEPPEWPFGPVGGGFEATPVVDAAGNAYVGATDGVFYSVAPSAPTRAGLERWSFQAPSPIRSAAAIKPLARDVPYMRVYFVTESGEMYALDGDGEVVWTHRLAGDVAPGSAPALAGKPGTPVGSLMRIFIATSRGVVALEETGSSSDPDVRELWREPLVVSDRSVAVRGDRVYATAGGAFYALRTQAAPGRQVAAQVNLGGQLTGPAIDADGRAYVGSHRGDLYRIDAPNASVLSSMSLPDPIRRRPALLPGGRAAILSGDVLHAVDRDLSRGRIAWRFPQPGQAASWTFASGLAADGTGRVFALASDGRLRALDQQGEAWRFPIQAGGYTNPALSADGQLYVGTQAGELHAIQSDPSFVVAYGGDQTQASSLDIHTLRSAYGTTGTVRRLTQDAAPESRPAYSPLGRWTAYETERGGGDRDVVVAHAAGTGAFNLDTDEPSNPFTVETDERDPSFSPVDRHSRSLLPSGGRYLAITFGSASDWRAAFIDLDALAENGTVSSVDLPTFLRSQSAPNAAAGVAGQQAQPTFSPDGSMLAYGACVQTASGAQRRLHVVNFGDDTRTTVNAEPAQNCSEAASFHPFFSPDSEHLVYETGGDIYLTGDMASAGGAITASIQLPLPPRLQPTSSADAAPAWSPDGTEIVVTRTATRRAFGRSGGIGGGIGSGRIGDGPNPGLRTTRSLVVLTGPDYGAASTLSPDISIHGAYHPRRLPKPETRIARCSASPTISPATQQPGDIVRIRGCGFDLRFPGNNTVTFPRADGVGTVTVAAQDTAVDPATGLGVIEVKTPMVAGDGNLVVDTPFGPSEQLNETFRVAPLATDLRAEETVPEAFIRVMGYGFETSDPGSYRVEFAGGGSVSPARVRMATCGQPPSTPCGLSRVAGGEIGWLEVQTPSNVAAGPVRVVRTIGGSTHSDQAPRPLSLLTPSVRLSRSDGSAGGTNLDPVEFRMDGSGFPIDPFFGYTDVDLVQVDPDGTETSLGQASVDSFNRFSSAALSVRPNSGGMLTMEARLPATRGQGTLASATAPFRTPLKDVPVVFVPGTSGTFLTHEDEGPSYGRACAAPIALSAVTAPLGATGAAISAIIGGITFPHIKSDYQPDENVWLNLHGLVHIFAECDAWLDAIHLNPQNDQAPSKYSDVVPERVMDEVELPGDNMVIYGELLEFMRNDMNREIVAYGDSCGGPQPCVYLFNQDWRKGMEHARPRLDALVNKALQETGAAKVAVITHSYGGPTTKYYLRATPGAAQKVDQVIALGGGHMGVVRPYKILEVGDHWSVRLPQKGPKIFALKDQKPQQMGRDWPTAYWQLPQSDWALDGSNGHGGVNSICPRIGKNGQRECGWIDAEWDATKARFGPFNFTSGPGVLGDGSSPYSFVAAATAHHPFRGRTLTKFNPNINNASGQTQFALGAVYDIGDAFSDKFGAARSKLLDVGGSANDSTLSCPRFGDTGLGDWRCGTQGVFFHRIVGWGKDTALRVKFAHDRKCIPVDFLPFVQAPACVHFRNIVPITGREGDGTIPLRSAVGILEVDGRFDTRDSRVWGLDASGKDDFDGDGAPDRETTTLHSTLPSMSSVQRFVEHAIAGELTDITQLPGPQPEWPSEEWPLLSPCGVPDRPNDVPKDGDCGAGAVATSHWVIQIDGDAAVMVTDEEGRTAGPASAEDPPGAGSFTFPGVSYDRSPGRTTVRLPVGSGRYEIALDREDGRRAGVEVPPYDIVALRIFPVGAAREEPMHVFHAVPISDAAEVRLDWNADGPGELPVLRFIQGDEVHELAPDATLTGSDIWDDEPPVTEIVRDDGRLVVEATDEGGSGVSRIYYGTDRARMAPKPYTGPVELPDDATYVWATAVDRAGNASSAPAIDRTCRLPMDFDGDGVVDEADVEAVADAWRRADQRALNLNGLGPVDVGDIARTIAHLGAACPADVSVAPDVVWRANTTAAIAPSLADEAVRVGERVVVDVMLRTPADIAGFETVVTYPGGLLTLEEVELGPELGPQGAAFVQLGPQPDDEAGAVTFGAFARESANFDSDVVLARLAFAAERPGEAPLRIFDARVGHRDGSLSRPSRESASLRVVEQ